LSVMHNPKGVPFPDILRCVMTYEQRQSVTCSSGIYNLQQFSANALYDPYITGSGGYPEFYGELSSLYNSYRVVKTHVNVIFSTVGTAANTQTFRLAMSIEPTATVPSTVEAVESAPYARRRICAGVTNPCPFLDMKMPMHKIFGVEKSAILDDTRYTGNVSSSPSNDAVINIAVQPLDGASTLTVYMEVRIKYFCEWYSRLTDTTQSLERLVSLKDRSLDSQNTAVFVHSCTGFGSYRSLPKAFGLI